MEFSVGVTDDQREKENDEALSTLYSVVATLAHIENAYLKSHMTKAAYEQSCCDYLARYEMSRAALGDKSLEDFLDSMGKRSAYRLAIDRISAGKPCTVANAAMGKKNVAHYQMEIGKLFVELADTVGLSEAPPEIRNKLEQLLMHIPYVPQGARVKGLDKLRQWSDKLGTMDSSQELDDAAKAQLSADLEISFESCKFEASLLE